MIRIVRERPEAAALALLAAASLISVWPLLWSGSIPAFQQDWAWPLSRGLSLQWLHAFIGLWDPRGLGQANPLPWETYVVIVEVAFVLVFGASLGLAVWLAVLVFGAAYTCWRMLGSFGVRHPWARFTAALFYAVGPVVLTRIAAGHLAYLLAYALLPLVALFARRALVEANFRPALLLGLAIGFSGSQVQFLAIDWLAVFPLLLYQRKAPLWGVRLIAAACISIAAQLQALLPLAISSTPSLYLAQRALISWEYNNSSQLSSAPIMLGYFTHYYGSHALPWAAVALYAVLGLSLVGACFAPRRLAAYAVILVIAGALFTAGLYGPISGILIWCFTHTPYMTAFRDLHYFAALTSLGTSILIAVALDRFRFALPALAVLVIWAVAPTLAGAELVPLLVPRLDVRDALADMRALHRHGSGRVLWLPAEEPLRLRGSANAGRDFTAYGPSGNSSVSDDLANPQLAYALATLRNGTPDWWAFRSMGIRYVVFRRYVRSDSEEDNLGTGFRLAYAALGDTALGSALAQDGHLAVLRRSQRSTTYVLRDAQPLQYVARAVPSAWLYSQLRPGEVALKPVGAQGLPPPVSTITADPRLAWVSGTIGWRYRPWLADAVYPFVWTVSRQPLKFTVPGPAGCVAVASSRGAELAVSRWHREVKGRWRPYTFRQVPAGSLVTIKPLRKGVNAVASLECGRTTGATSVFADARSYDAGWRVFSDVLRLAPPRLANGWMMAWPTVDQRRRRIYLPAIAQAAGFLIFAFSVSLFVAGPKVLARRRGAPGTPQSDIQTQKDCTEGESRKKQPY